MYHRYLSFEQTLSVTTKYYQTFRVHYEITVNLQYLHSHQWKIKDFGIRF